MKHIQIDEADSFDFGGGVEHRTLREPLGLADVTINRYRIDPDGALPWGLHAHGDQEEVFIVTSGTVSFETLDGVIDVRAGDAIRFAPGEHQAARNDGTEPVSYIAIGAPPDSTDIRIPRPCPSCSGTELVIGEDFGELTCPSCSTTISTACSACGEDDREVRLTDDETALVDRCRSCGDRSIIRELT